MHAIFHVTKKYVIHLYAVFLVSISFILEGLIVQGIGLGFSLTTLCFKRNRYKTTHVYCLFFSEERKQILVNVS